MLLHIWQRVCVAAIASAMTLPALAQNQPGAQPQPPAPGQAEEGLSQPGAPNRPAPPPGSLPREEGALGQAQFGANRGLSDSAIAQWLLAEIESQVQIGQFVAQNADNDQVKQFAQQAVKEHKAQAQALQQFVQDKGQNPAAGNRPARGRNIPGRGNPQARPGDRPASTNPQPETNRDPSGNVRQGVVDPARPGVTRQSEPEAPTAQPGTTRTTRKPAARPVQAQNPAIALKQQIDKQQAQMITQMMKETSPDALGAWYVGEQLLAHINMKATVQALQQKAQSPQLKQLLAKTEKDLTNHINKTQQLMESLDGSRQQGSSRRSEQ